MARRTLNIEIIQSLPFYLEYIKTRNTVNRIIEDLHILHKNIWRTVITTYTDMNCIISRRPGGGGVFKFFFSEIEFLVVSYRGDRYLSDAFGPMKKYCS